VEWYNRAKALPSSRTRRRFKSLTGYTLNGPWSTYSLGILTAFDDEGAAALLKVVDEREHAAEIAAALAVSGGPGVVKSRLCSAADSEGRDFSGLLMAKYERSLDAAPDVVLAEGVLFDRATTLLAALRHVHACGLVHMDVKEANVFVDAAGGWALGDFGSAVREGAPVTSTTPGLHPALAGWERAAPPVCARRGFDLFMAAGLLVRQLDAPAARAPAAGAGPRAADLAARAARVEHAGLRELLLRLLEEAAA
jgi:hypothetical protein